MRARKTYRPPANVQCGRNSPDFGQLGKRRFESPRRRDSGLIADAMPVVKKLATTKARTPKALGAVARQQLLLVNGLLDEVARNYLARLHREIAELIRVLERKQSEPANGTMHVIPRGDEELLSHERDGASNHHIKCVVDESKAVPIELPAGGALFFNYAVPHCTKGNNTDHERAGLALHFLREDAVVNPDWKNATLTGPNSTNGVKEFGKDQRHQWERQVESMELSATA